MKEKIKALKNTVGVGLLIGFLAPILPAVLSWFLMHRISFLQKADLLLIGCIAINAFLMNYFFKLDKENIGRGILGITFLWAFAFFFYKILQEIN